MTKQEFKVEIGPENLTRFERAKIIGSRALQLSLGAPTFVKISKDIHDPIVLATYAVSYTHLTLPTSDLV